MFTQENESELSELEGEVSYHTKIFDMLREVEEPEDRKIGHLVYYPSLTISSQEPGFLRDWGRLELEAEKFPAGSYNKVFIGNGFDSGSTKNLFADPETAVLDNGFLLLSLDDRPEEANKAFYVAKRGATTDLTFGVRSAVEALVRKPSRTGKSFISWEAPIVSLPGSSRGFSDKGDSGSSVFDLEGRVVGLVTGRAFHKEIDRKGKVRPNRSITPKEAIETPELLTKWPQGADITFSSPIEWVLKDIEITTRF